MLNASTDKLTMEAPLTDKLSMRGKDLANEAGLRKTMKDSLMRGGAAHGGRPDLVSRLSEKALTKEAADSGSTKTMKNSMMRGSTG